MQSEIILVSHSGVPLTGTVSGAAFAWPGNALSANTSRVRGDLLRKLDPLGQPVNRLKMAIWRLVWNPQVSSAGSPTGVRLGLFDDGPTNFIQMCELRKNVVCGTPVNEQVIITTELNAAINSGLLKNIGHQTFGNGANGCLIYASKIELVWEDD